MSTAFADFTVATLDPDLSPDPEYLSLVRDPATSLAQMVQGALTTYRDRPAFAWRPLRSGQLSDGYTIIDYAEFGDRVMHIAAALAHEPALGLEPGDPVGIMAFANVDFAALNLALVHNGLPIAPLQTTAQVVQLEGLVRELRAKCLAASLEHLVTTVGLAIACPETRCVLVFDCDGMDNSELAQVEAQRVRLKAAKPDASILLFSETRARGAALPPAKPFNPAKGEDPLAIIYYTSGSTGTPKGVMYGQRLVKPAWAMARSFSPIVLHYQPLNHSFGMSYIFMAIAGGGITCFTGRSDLSTLLEDIATVRPTAMSMVPRICELLYQRFHAQYPGELSNAEKDRAYAEFRQSVFGGRLRDVVAGSAPMAPELRAFVEGMLQLTIIESYGASEVSGVTMNNRVTRPPVIDYKLLDVPELGYFTTDKPHPRGELIVRTSSMFAGYFARPDLTAAAVDAEGYYHTGDIMAEPEPDVLVYLDRRNNVIKLAQGEFVAIAQLETLFASSDPSIAQVYLYGNSTRAYLLGVIVPNPDVLPARLGEAEIKEHLLAAIRRIGTENKLNAYEMPRDIVVEFEPFSTENGLLAGIGKHMRPAFRARYEERLEALYAAHASEQAAEVDDLRKNGRERPMADTLRRAAASILGIDTADMAEDTSFAALGGDSLAGLSYALLLEDIYGFPVDVGTIMHPAGSFAQLEQDIARQVTGQGQGVTALDVHGPDQGVIRAVDLKLEKFINPAILAAAPGISPVATGEPKCVLLTGANGFLGRFLALEWLKRLEKNGGRLICIARGADDASARTRLLAAFDGGDGALAADVARLSAGLEVIAADLAQPRLGLSSESWTRLANEVDLIVHPAALVNHKLPYGQLFRPNVAGTATLIELALTTRAKRIVHVSTVAAAVHNGKIAREDDDVRDVIPEWNASTGYADGYGASKWAAEVLLREANAHFGLPVSVFRSGMILAPTTYSGQLNIPDMFTRLILSLAATRLAPDSFYLGDARPHYDGLPVDFIAADIAAIGAIRQSGFHTFHVINPHDDGISQDTFVEWLETLGYTMTRAPFASWRERFEVSLRTLPDELRQASILPLLDALDRPQPAKAGPTIPNPRFVEATAEAKLTADGEVPHLGPELIARYVADLKGAGLLC